MSYLHCHNCCFSQDDFWDNGYNPFTCFQDDLKTLLTEDLDEMVKMDSCWLKETGYPPEGVSKRELVLHHLRQIKARIEGMVYRTTDELKEKNPDGVCPECGAKDLDID